jgi:hypothetical protein
LVRAQTTSPEQVDLQILCLAPSFPGTLRLANVLKEIQQCCSFTVFASLEALLGTYVVHGNYAQTNKQHDEKYCISRLSDIDRMHTGRVGRGNNINPMQNFKLLYFQNWRR